MKLHNAKLFPNPKRTPNKKLNKKLKKILKIIAHHFLYALQKLWTLRLLTSGSLNPPRAKPNTK